MDPEEAFQYQQQQQQMYYNHFNQQYQQQYGAPVDPQLYQQYQQQQFYYYQRQQQLRQEQQRPLRPLPPLQQLRNPSDLRKSTIQTFTDFRPRVKNQTVMSSPEGKQPFVPIENDNVWTSPINSPSIQSQASFLASSTIVIKVITSPTNNSIRYIKTTENQTPTQLFLQLLKFLDPR